MCNIMPESSGTSEMIAHPVWCDALRGDGARTEVRDGRYVDEAPAETGVEEHRGHVCHVDAGDYFSYSIRGALVQSWERFNGALLENSPRIDLSVSDRDFEPEVTVWLNAHEARRTAEMLLHLADTLEKELGRWTPIGVTASAVAEGSRLGYRAGQGDGQAEGHQAGAQGAELMRAVLRSAEQLDGARLDQLVEYAQQIRAEQAAPPLMRAETCPGWCEGHQPFDLERSWITDHWRDVARVPASADDPVPPIPGDVNAFRLGSVGVACTQEDDESRPTVYLHATQPRHDPGRGEDPEREVDMHLSAKDADDLAAALVKAARLIRGTGGAAGRRRGDEEAPLTAGGMTDA